MKIWEEKVCPLGIWSFRARLGGNHTHTRARATARPVSARCVFGFGPGHTGAGRAKIRTRPGSCEYGSNRSGSSTCLKSRSFSEQKQTKSEEVQNFCNNLCLLKT